MLFNPQRGQSQTCSTRLKAPSTLAASYFAGASSTGTTLLDVLLGCLTAVSRNAGTVPCQKERLVASFSKNAVTISTIILQGCMIHLRSYVKLD